MWTMIQSSGTFFGCKYSKQCFQPSFQFTNAKKALREPGGPHLVLYIVTTDNRVKLNTTIRNIDGTHS